MAAPIIHRSTRPDVAIPDVAITPFVFERAGEHPDRLAFVDGATGRGVTYGSLLDSIARAAAGFAARGIGHGDVVAIMAPNVPEYAVVEEQGPGHRKRFRVQCLVQGRPLGEGEGFSKKEAQQDAARKALEVIESAGEAL